MRLAGNPQATGPLISMCRVGFVPRHDELVKQFWYYAILWVNLNLRVTPWAKTWCFELDSSQINILLYYLINTYISSVKTPDA
jgi:hypothetical protein